MCIVKCNGCVYCVCFHLVPHVHEKLANSKYRKIFLEYIYVLLKNICIRLYCGSKNVIFLQLFESGITSE